MIHRNKAIIVAVALMVASLAAFGQANQKAQQRRAAISEAVKAIGLSQDQVAKIREVRRERPPEGTTGAARRAWRQEISQKLMAVLTDEQKEKVSEVRAMAADSKVREGAVLLGLAQRQNRNQQNRNRRPGGN